MSELPIVLHTVGLRAREVTIIDAVTLTLGAGGPTVLVGPNGAGKSSLLRLCMGLVRPTSGTVTWGGHPAATSGFGTGKRAIVMQRPVMLRRSAAANVRFALKAAGVPRAARAQRATALLATVGLHDLGDRPARTLSGGEQQRLALARALAREPQVLFLDEPTASLDPAATKAVEDLIHGIVARGIKVVMATHDLGEARRIADEIVLMHRGRVVEVSGTTAFFSKPQTEAARRFVAGELLT